MLILKDSFKIFSSYCTDLVCKPLSGESCGYDKHVGECCEDKCPRLYHKWDYAKVIEQWNKENE